ncbi:MAG: hypothetical protein K2P53_02935 [Rickettsiales bacterium]|nr:hypothetical protein [Rickettsiales bacterium]
MPSESEILTSIGNGGLIEGIDPLYYAAMLRIQLEEKSPVLWAIENGKKIDNKDPLLYALLNEGFDVNKNVLEAVPEGYQINVSDEVLYSVEEFKTKIVESIISRQDFEGLNTQELMKIAINGNFMINGKSPIQYAIENHTNGLQQGVKSILKEQGRDDQLKEFYQNLANNPAENSQLIELFANEYNATGRGKENFVEVMCPLVEQGIKVPDSLVELYIKDKLKEEIPSIDRIHEKHKEQALFSVIDLYLDEYTSDKDKENLKVMYEKLAKDLDLDTKKKDSALVKFVSDPEECANKIKNLLNKLPKQDTSDLNIEGSAQNIDLKSLYKQYDLETLKNLNDVGNKLGEIDPEVQNFSIAGKIGIGIGIALAIITVIPGIIIGIMKLVSASSAKQELKDQQSEALKVNQELGELGVVKPPVEGVQANSAGTKKFTETVLKMRLDTKANIGAGV